MKRIVAAYVACFLVTYGHAYHNIGDSSWQAPSRAFGALIIASFWPLYLAVEVFAPGPSAAIRCTK